MDCTLINGAMARINYYRYTRIKKPQCQYRPGYKDIVANPYENYDKYQQGYFDFLLFIQVSSPTFISFFEDHNRCLLVVVPKGIMLEYFC